MKKVTRISKNINRVSNNTILDDKKHGHIRRPSSVDSIIKDRLGEQRLMGTLFEAMDIVYRTDKYQSDGDEDEDGAGQEDNYLEVIRKQVKELGEERLKELHKKQIEDFKKKEEQKTQKVIKSKCQCVKNTQGKIKKRCQACKIKREQLQKKNMVQINYNEQFKDKAQQNNNTLQNNSNIENNSNIIDKRKSILMQPKGIQQMV